MEYRCVATSVEGFVQQLAVSYITHGYWFYVTGTIPDGKDPAAVDAKLIARYGIAISKWARCRRKKQGLANMQYLRHERFFVLLATKGRHEFFERERASVLDVRRKSIKFAGYCIGCRKGRDGRWHVTVRLAGQILGYLKAQVRDLVLPGCTGRVRRGLGDFAQIKWQLLSVLQRAAIRKANGDCPSRRKNARRTAVRDE
ncbi:MAG: hypothetical protein IPM64_12530 [Phycisphaerales bacterium]|nr:hypothetical protein [Phycisphaerales bacterium]